MCNLYHFSCVHHDKSVSLSKLSSPELLVKVPDEDSESDSLGSKLQGAGIKESEALVQLESSVAAIWICTF